MCVCGRLGVCRAVYMKMGEYESGYCYLVWFDVLVNAGYECNIEAMKGVFGLYPRVRSVIGYIYALLDRDVMLPAPRLVFPGVYHVNLLNEWISFRVLMNELLGSTARVGALFVDECVDFNDKVRAVAELARCANMDMRTVIAEAAQVTLRNAVRNDSSVVNVLLNDMSRVSTKRKFSVPYCLSVEETARLQSAFPELGVVVVPSVRHPHAMAAAVRMCVEEYILGCMKYDRKNYIERMGDDCVLVDVGANVVRHALAGRFNIHCCVPIMDVRDSARETERELMLDSMVRDKRLSMRVRDEYVRGGLLRCFKKGEECCVRARYGMMMHSTYDVSKNAMCGILDAHEFDVMWCVFLFDASVLCFDNGVLEGVNANFRVEKGRIRFGFMGDSSLCYDHDYKDYVGWLTDSVIVTRNGRCYLIQRVDMRVNHMIVKFVYCKVAPSSMEVRLSFSYFYENFMKDSVVVATWEYDDGFFLDSKWKMCERKNVRVKRKFLKVSRRLYEMVLTHCLRSGDKSFNLNEIYSCATSYNTRMTINGADVRAPERVSPEVLMDLVVAVFCVSFKKRYVSGKLIETFTKEQKFKRESGKMGFMDVLRYVWHCVSNGSFFGFGRLWNRFVDRVAAEKALSIMDVEMFNNVCCMDVSEFVRVYAEFVATPYDCGDLNVMTRELDVDLEKNKVSALGSYLDRVCVNTELGVECVAGPKFDRVVESDVCVGERKEVNERIVRNDRMKNDKKFVRKSSKNVLRKSANAFVRSKFGVPVESDCVSNDVRSEVRLVRKFLTTCDCDLVHVVRGDGHCVFGALQMHVGACSGMDVRNFRKLLYVLCDENEKNKHEILMDVSGRRSAWGSTDEVTLFSKLFNVTVCMHCDCDGQQFVTTAYTADCVTGSKIVHLKWVLNGGIGHVDVLSSGVIVDLSEELYECVKARCSINDSRDTSEWLAVMCMLRCMLGTDEWFVSDDVKEHVANVVSKPDAKVGIFSVKGMPTCAGLKRYDSVAVWCDDITHVDVVLMNGYGIYDYVLDWSVLNGGMAGWVICREKGSGSVNAVSLFSQAIEMYVCKSLLGCTMNAGSNEWLQVLSRTRVTVDRLMESDDRDKFLNVLQNFGLDCMLRKGMYCVSAMCNLLKKECVVKSESVVYRDVCVTRPGVVKSKRKWKRKDSFGVHVGKDCVTKVYGVQGKKNISMSGVHMDDKEQSVRMMCEGKKDERVVKMLTCVKDNSVYKASRMVGNGVVDVIDCYCEKVVKGVVSMNDFCMQYDYVESDVEVASEISEVKNVCESETVDVCESEGEFSECCTYEWDNSIVSIEEMHECEKGDYDLRTNSRECVDTGRKIDECLRMTAVTGDSLCVLGGASKSKDTNVRMFTKYVRSVFSKCCAIDPRFKNDTDEYKRCMLEDFDFSVFDVVFSDVYDKEKENLCAFVLLSSGLRAKVFIKFTWSSVCLKIVRELVVGKFYWRILRTAASGTSSEVFLYVNKAECDDLNVCVCECFNKVWEHVECCDECKNCVDGDVMTDIIGCVYMCGRIRKEIVIDDSGSESTTSVSASEKSIKSVSECSASTSVWRRWFGSRTELRAVISWEHVKSKVRVMEYKRGCERVCSMLYVHYGVTDGVMMYVVVCENREGHVWMPKEVGKCINVTEYTCFSRLERRCYLLSGCGIDCDRVYCRYVLKKGLEVPMIVVCGENVNALFDATLTWLQREFHERGPLIGLSASGVSSVSALASLRKNDSLHICVYEYRGRGMSYLANVGTYGCEEKEVVTDCEKVVDKAVVFPKLSNSDLECLRLAPQKDGDSLRVRVMNAMLEYRHCVKLADDVNKVKLREWYKRVTTARTKEQIDELIRLGINVYDNEERKYVFRCETDNYMCGYVVDEYVCFNEDERKFDTKVKYVMVCRQTKKMLNQMTYLAIRSVNVETVSVSKLVWVNGVPGCGKTTYIVESHRPAVDGIVHDMIVSATCEGVCAIRMKVKEKFQVDEGALKRDYRTLASLLINGTHGCKYERVFLDEALMVHAGAIGFVMYVTGCKELCMLGDRNQIPYVDRDHVCEILYSDVSKFCDVTRNLVRTYRCPIDVCYVLRKLYPGIHTESKVCVSMCVKPFSGNVIPYESDTLYLTHVQADKDYLRREGYEKNGSKVLSVHEAQGLTWKNVIVVRMQQKPLEIYDRREYAVVAMTRHTKSLVYYSDVSDALSKLMLKGVVSAGSLLAWNGENRMYADEHKLHDGLKAKMTAGFSFGVSECGHKPALMCEWGQSEYDDRSDLLASLPHSDYESMRVNVVDGCSVCEQSYATNVIKNVKQVCDRDVRFLQEFYDDKMPGVSESVYDYDQCMVEMSDLLLNVDHLDVNVGAGAPKVRKFDKLKPVLRTVVSAKRVPSQRESVLGMIKRNLNVPVLLNDMDGSVLGMYLFKNFIRSVVRDDCMDLVELYKFETVGMHGSLVGRWLQTQKPATAALCMSDVSMHERRANVFEFMVKGDVKPALDPRASNTYASVQTIAYNSKDVNVMFCPVFLALRDRLLNVLKEKLFVMTGVSNEDFERKVNAYVKLAALNLNVCDRVELDMSKYDKAQACALFTFEMLLYEWLGMDGDLLEIWRNAHEFSRLRDRKNGVSATTRWQRKSGDASTFFGNTVVLLAVLCACYDVDDIAMLLAAGDDSVIWFRPGVKVAFNPSAIMADLFNLECKLLCKYDVMYFCSKFVCVEDDWIYFVPDVVKVLAKLGRRDMCNWEHVEAYRVSCVDSWKNFERFGIVAELSKGLCERYGGRIECVSKVLNVLCTIVKSEKLFRSLYVCEEWMNLCADPSMGAV